MQYGLTNLVRSARATKVTFFCNRLARYSLSSVCNSRATEWARATSCDLLVWACSTDEQMNLITVSMGTSSGTKVRGKHCRTSSIVVGRMEGSSSISEGRYVMLCPHNNQPIKFKTAFGPDQVSYHPICDSNDTRLWEWEYLLLQPKSAYSDQSYWKCGKMRGKCVKIMVLRHSYQIKLACMRPFSPNIC
jgi:hypothetical protein